MVYHAQKDDKKPKKKKIFFQDIKGNNCWILFCSIKNRHFLGKINNKYLAIQKFYTLRDSSEDFSCESINITGFL